MTDRSKRLGLEPGSKVSASVKDWPGEGEIAHSIAISLKRIADSLQGIDASIANSTTRHLP